jgi:lipopolysaccharide export LptBFGC system permease protein LptF
MLLLDRYILGRFAGNFALLFTLLFLFAVGIDVLLNLDEFLEVARAAHAGALPRLWAVILLVFDFQAPRLFLFYGYLHGLIAIGAAAFTLAHMHRHGELTAVVAAGVGLGRLAVPLVLGTFAVSGVQLLNQEFVLHRVAPLVLRGRSEIGRASMSGFPVRFVDDGAGNIWHASGYDPQARVLSRLVVLERDQRGRTTRRVAAEAAAWDAEAAGWRLTQGSSLAMDQAGEGREGMTPLEFYPGGLNPGAITLHRYGAYAAMLNLRQIAQLLESGRVADADTLLRHRYARFAMVAANLLVLFICLPWFLLREPAGLMRNAILCASVAIPALIGAALGMTIALPGVPPAVGVFLPVAPLIPLAAGRWAMLKT